MLDGTGIVATFTDAGFVAVDGEQSQFAAGTLGCCHGGGGEGPQMQRGRTGAGKGRAATCGALACREQPAQPGGALDAIAMAALVQSAGATAQQPPG